MMINLIPLSIFAAFLVIASVGISVLNWSSMPAAGWGTAVAALIALGVEGAKLILTPYAVYTWRDSKALAVCAGAMALVMTLVSVGGIVIWMDTNLEYNSGAKHSLAMDAKVRDLEVKAAEAYIDLGYISKGRAALTASKTEETEEKPTEARTSGLVIPFDMSRTAHLTLLVAIAVTIDLGALLLVTIITLGLRAAREDEDQREEPSGAHTFTTPEDLRQSDATAIGAADAIKATLDNMAAVKDSHVIVTPSGFRRVAPNPKPTPVIEQKPLTDRERSILEAMLSGRHGSPLESAKKIATEHKIRYASVKNVLDYGVDTGLLFKNNSNRYELAPTGERAIA